MFFWGTPSPPSPPAPLLCGAAAVKERELLHSGGDRKASSCSVACYYKNRSRRLLLRGNRMPASCPSSPEGVCYGIQRLWYMVSLFSDDACTRRRSFPQASRALSRFFLVASRVLSRFSVASRALSRFKLGRVVSPAAPGRGLSRVLCPPLQSRLAPAGPPVDVVAGPAFVEVPLAVGPAPARPVPAARGVGAARSCAPLTLLLGRPRRRRLHLLAHLHRHVAPLLVHTPDGAVPGLGAVAAVPTAGTDNTPTPR